MARRAARQEAKKKLKVKECSVGNGSGCSSRRMARKAGTNDVRGSLKDTMGSMRKLPVKHGRRSRRRNANGRGNAERRYKKET